jgi:thioredoxin reductase
MEDSEMKNENLKELPVAIIGAGPIGLAAASQLAIRGQKFIIMEAGSEIAHNIRKWEHVRLFSPWQYNVDKAAKELLNRHDWKEPHPEGLPLGKDLLSDYLEPLAELPEIQPYLSLNSRVVSISRKSIDKMKNNDRENQPFVLYVENGKKTKRIEAKAVIDSTGTWGSPNPINSEGIWTEDERLLHEHIYYGIPNVKDVEGFKYKGKRIAVVGGGHSALNTLIDLAKLKESNPETELFWIMRKRKVEEAYGGEENDQLEARGMLGSLIHQLVISGTIQVITPYYIQQVSKSENGIILTGEREGGVEDIEIDEIIVNTGSRPDFSFLGELRLSIDQTTESVEQLAPLIDPNVHSCGTVRPHGEKELRHAEKDFYIVGMKSYGRAPTFLMATGYEQVRSIAAYITGDIESALKVELVLPETGVCSISNSHISDENSCCGHVVQDANQASCNKSDSGFTIPVKNSSSCCN